MSTVFKALADPTRRHILKLLKTGPLTAGEIAGHFAISKPTLSAHFAVLREAELIGSEKQGKHITYWLNASVLEEIVVSDSIPLKQKGSKIKVLTVSDLFAKAIRKIHDNESISSLFIKL